MSKLKTCNAVNAPNNEWGANALVCKDHVCKVFKALNKTKGLPFLLLLLFFFAKQNAGAQPSGLKFNGTNQYMMIASHDDFQIRVNEAITLSYWVKTNTPTVTQRLVSKEYTSPSTGDAAILRTGYGTTLLSSRIYATWRYQGTNREAYPAATIGAEWFHLAVVFDMNPTGAANPYTATVYKDGVMLQSFQCNHGGDLISTADVYVGALRGDAVATTVASYFNGEMANLRFYKKALSASDIQTDMAANVPLSGFDLVAAYDFQSITQSGGDLVIADISGNNHKGVLYNYHAKAPTINTHPQNSPVTAGNTHTLSVSATSVDGGVLTYQWYSNESASNVGGNPILGATQSTYEVPATLTAGTYYYYVQVTNTGTGSTTATATSNAATIQVTGMLSYAVTVSSEGAGASGSNNYLAGAQINVYAGIHPDGKIFSHWTSSPAVTFDNASSVATFFTMPAGAVTVTAHFVERMGLKLNGTNQYMRIASHNDFQIPSNEALTISFWVKPGRTNINQRFVSKCYTSGDEVYGATGYAVALLANSIRPYASWRYNGTNREIYPTATVNVDEWFHMAVVFDMSTTTATIYKDGTALASNSTSPGGPIFSSSDVYVGVAAPNPTSIDSHFFGEMANLRFYKKALGASDTQADVAANAPLAGSDLVAAYDFQNITQSGSDWVIADISGNNHTGFFHGYSPMAVSNIVTQVQCPVAWENNGILHISGLTAGKVWKLYNTTGVLVKQGIAGSDVVTVSLNFHGIYIIQSEACTLKVAF